MTRQLQITGIHKDESSKNEAYQILSLCHWHLLQNGPEPFKKLEKLCRTSPCIEMQQEHLEQIRTLEQMGETILAYLQTRR
jgi:hypothetical protein